MAATANSLVLSGRLKQSYACAGLSKKASKGLYQQRISPIPGTKRRQAITARRLRKRSVTFIYVQRWQCSYSLLHP